MTNPSQYETIEEIKQAIIDDPKNQTYTEKGIMPIFKVNPLVKVLIVGQAPGKKAEETGLFWNDPSGDRLRDWLGLSRETFYGLETLGQLPMDFYYPGKAKSGDAPPRKGFAQKWHPPLLQAMPALELIILVGKYSQKYYLADKAQKNLTETVRNYHLYLPKYFPIVHPSPLNGRWLKTNPWFESQVVPELKQLVQGMLF